MKNFRFAGTLTLGGFDNSSFLNKNYTIYYTPIIEESYYVVEFKDILIGNQSASPDKVFLIMINLLNNLDI